MGAETAIAAGITGASAIYGASQARRAGKEAKRTANEQSQALTEDRTRIGKEQAVLSGKVEQAQRKIAAGQARVNRSRLRGGVFGESQPTTRNLNPNLG